MVIFLYNQYILRSIFEPCYIQNHVIRNHVIKRLMCIFQDTVYPIDLRESDLTNVDDDGYTLIMLAAKHDK